MVIEKFINSVAVLFTFLCLNSCTVQNVRGCPHGDVRLVNITAAYQGNVEVCIAGRWSAVCADRISNQEAIIVCRQLGCAYGTRQQSTCYEKSYRFQCLGGEANLTSCSVLNSYNCFLNEEVTCVGVECSECNLTSSKGLLPYGNSTGDSHLPNRLDVSSESVALKHSFPYFGSSENTTYVNSHGVLSFRSQFGLYTQSSLPFDSVPLILIYWIDTDTTHGGDIYYREANDSETLRMSRSLLSTHEPYFHPISVFVATWSEVLQTGQRLFTNISNTYQAVLMTDGELSFVCLLYEEVQWGSGAQIGFNAGKENRSLTVPGGLTNKTLNMETLSNVGQPGLFIYQVNSNKIRSPWPWEGKNAPTHLLASHSSSTTLRLTWTSNVTADIYNIYCYHLTCPYCSHLPTLEVLQTTQTVITVRRLVPYTQYTCCITSLLYDLESDCSEEVNVRTLAVAPTTPRNVTVTDVTASSVQLEWSIPQYTNGTITHYTIRCTQSSRSVWSSTGLGRSEFVTDLQPFTNYTCCVSASNQAGEGDEKCVTAFTLQVPPTVPLNVSVTKVTTSSVQLEWSSPQYTNGTITHYTVRCTQSGQPVWFSIDVNISEAVLTDLEPLTNYTCCVSASNQAGEGSRACLAALTFPGFPTTPVGVVVTSTDASSGQLTWREPANTYGQRIVLFHIHCVSTLNHSLTQKVYGLNTSVVGLNSNTNYTCCVSAVSAVGLGKEACVLVSTEPLTNAGSVNLMTIVSGGIVATVMALLIVIIAVIVCWCIKRKPSHKKDQQSTTDPASDGAVELKEVTVATPTANTTQTENVYAINNSNIPPTQFHKRDYKEEVDIRYQRPIIKSRVETAMRANVNPKKPMLPKKPQTRADTSQHHYQTEEPTYQPLIPTKTYMKPANSESAEYQDLTFETREPRSQDQSLATAVSSEGQYEPVRRPEETNQYEPLTFGMSPQATSEYQSLTKRDESSYYQNLSHVHRN